MSAPVFLVAGALAVKPIERPRASFSAALAGAGLALAALSSLFAVWLGGRWTGDAENALGTDNARAVTLAKRARSVQPLSVEPIFIQALAEQLQRHFGETLGLLREATRLQPENKETSSTFAFGTARASRSASSTASRSSTVRIRATPNTPARSSR